MVVKYENGDSCAADPTKKRSTTIELLCDVGQVVSSPTFVSDNGCEVTFQWLSAYACTTQAETTRDNCTAVDPITGHVFDLNHDFMHDLITFVDNGITYNLAICKAHKSCPAGMGACTTDSKEKVHSLGKGKIQVSKAG